MARPRKPMTQKIREMLAAGKAPHAITKRVGCEPNYVYRTKWHDENKEKVREIRNRNYAARYENDPKYRRKRQTYSRLYMRKRRAALKRRAA